MLRLELLKVKADLERELETWSLNCTKCGLDVHWVGGLGTSPGHWAHRKPAPHGEPAVWAELLIDCEEDRVLRAVLVGMLRETYRGR